MLRCEICGKETRFLVSVAGLKTKFKLACIDCAHKKKKVVKS